MILGIKRRARKARLDLDLWLVREKEYDRGKLMSRYKLTDEGRKVLSEAQ